MEEGDVHKRKLHYIAMLSRRENSVLLALMQGRVEGRTENP